MHHLTRLLALTTTALAVSASALAGESALRIDDPYIRLVPPGTTTTVYVGPVWCADCGARMRAEDEARQAASRRAWAEEVYARHFAAVGGDRAATLAALERVYEEWEE